MSNKKYVIDACVLIDASKYYPLGLETFRDIWDKMSEMFDAGALISSSEIYDEIKDTDLLEWLKKYRKCFLPLEEDIQEKTKEVLKEFPNMVNINKNRKSTSNGDPFLVATAIVKSGIIVTNERKGANKIPTVSEKFGVRTIDLTQFIKEIMK